MKPTSPWPSRLAILLILLGAAARAALYARTRSLWVDEASLALNIVGRSFAELFKPLDYAQGAPIGFLLLEKLSVTLFGNSEYALRLVPLIGSVLSLPLFYAVARRFLSPSAMLAALALFALSPTLIYYASEVKQYSTDVTVTLLILWLLFQTRDPASSLRSLLPLAIAGALAIWLSHPALFVLAGTFLTLVLTPYVSGEPQPGRNRPVVEHKVPLMALGVMAATWALSFAAAYFISLRALSKDPLLRTYWNADFPPLPVSVSRINWYFRTLLAMFQNPAGVGLAGLSAAAALLGLRYLYRHSRWTLFALALPLAVTFAAAAGHAYPFRGRLLLFTAPILILLIAAGIDLARLAAANPLSPHRFPLAAILATLLIAYTARGAAMLLSSVRPDPEYSDLPHREELRPVVRYLADHLQPGDAVFVYSGQPYMYYAGRFNIAQIDWETIHPTTYDFQSSDWSSRADALATLRNHRRAWIVLSHVFSPEGDDQLPAQSALIDTLGKRLESFTASGAAIYLYDTTHE